MKNIIDLGDGSQIIIDSTTTPIEIRIIQDEDEFVTNFYDLLFLLSSKDISEIQQEMV